jgi:prevent-host-death family protein
MQTFTINAAKAILSQCLARVEAGEVIILARGKKPIAKLVPFEPPREKRQFGALRGIISIGPDFFQPLSESELATWE